MSYNGSLERKKNHVMIDKRDLGHIEFTETSTETDYDVQD